MKAASNTQPCLTCGYDLSATPSSGRCPECGNPALDVRQVIDGRAVAHRYARMRTTVIVLAVIIALILLLMRTCSY